MSDTILNEESHNTMISFYQTNYYFNNRVFPMQLIEKMIFF